MDVIETGRICIKKKGREAGKKCVVIGTEKNFATVMGERVKKRKCNIVHLFPTEKKIEIKKGMKEEKIIDLLKKEGK
ncbi:MAG: 50S ribosomal protein L14e [archaeon]